MMRWVILQVSCTLLAGLPLLGLSSPSFALQSCELEVQLADKSWQEVAFAGRGDEFFDKSVNKLDDGDTCRSQGRKYGPGECRDLAGVQYRTTAVRNNGNRKVWQDGC